ncbi:MAG: DUF3488 domain-containing protein [Deltaproteobacteria bacterium]|nr:DUF3488 domain-containing protein [Deltaproteobacteria bacterium]
MQYAVAPASDPFDRIRHWSITILVIISQILLVWADPTARPFHLAVLGAAVLGLVLPERQRLSIPVAFWNTAVVLMLAGAVLWIRQDPVMLFEVLLYFLELLLVVKLFSRRQSRDYWQIVVAAYFILIAGVMAMASVWTMVLLVVVLGFIVMALVADTAAEPAAVSGNFDQPVLAGEGDPAGDLRTGTVLTLTVTIVVAAATFVAIPRLSRAMFDIGMFRTGGGTRSGFSGQVDLAQRGEIGLDPSVVGRLRIQPVGDGLPDEMFYVVGRRLDHFDGILWYADDSNATPVYPSRGGILWLRPEWPDQRARRYEILLKPIGQPFLPHLERTIAIRFAHPVQLATSYPQSNVILAPIPSQPIRYDGWFTDLPMTDTSRADPVTYLTAIPETIDPRVKLLAASLAAGNPGTRETIRRIDQHLRATGFHYSLERPATGSEDIVASFLFDSKQGHCEYFASAAALLARLNGIPARVVTGFLVRERASEDEWLIRMQNAHAWVEYLDPVSGWNRLDPSPRDPGIELAAQTRWWLSLQTLIGRIEFWWHDKVIDFEQADQFRMLKALLDQLNRIGHRENKTARTENQAETGSSTSIRDNLGWAVAAIMAFVLIGAGYSSAIRRKRARQKHPATGYYLQLAAVLGINDPEDGGIPAGKAVSDAVDRRKLTPAQRERIRLWVEMYHQGRFGHIEGKPGVKQLGLLTSELIASLSMPESPANPEHKES